MRIDGKSNRTRTDSFEMRSYQGAVFPVSVRTALFAIVVIILMMTDLSSAMAEVEDVSVRDGFASEDMGLTSSLDFVISLLVANDLDSIVTASRSGTVVQEDNADNATRAKAITSPFDKSGASEKLNSFRSAFFPDAVWSLDSSTGAHFEHNSREPGSEFVIIPEGAQKNSDFWANLNLSWEWNKIDDRNAEALASPSTIIQVASCAGRYAEHSDLEYCDIDNNAVRQAGKNSGEVQNSDDNQIISPQGSTDTTSTITTTSTSPQGTQDPPTTPVAVNNIVPQKTIDLTALSEQCSDTFGSCATTQTVSTDFPPALTDSSPASTDSPPALTDFPPAPTDPPTELIPPTTLISVGDPGPIADPPIASPPPLGASPIPETSTWMMMIIGFAIMMVACMRRAPNTIKGDTVDPFQRSPNRH